MQVDDVSTLLPRLAVAIETSLAAWEAYLEDVSGQATYETIISSDIKEVGTKVKALEYLLDVLPSRHMALVLAYCDSENNSSELSDVCATLLEELQKPGSDLDLEAWFSKTITSKRFIKDIVGLEKDLKDDEQSRLQDLRRLKAVHSGLMEVLADGELAVEEVDALLTAMEEVGVSLAGSGAINEAVDLVGDGAEDHTMSGQ